MPAPLASVGASARLAQGATMSASTAPTSLAGSAEPSRKRVRVFRLIVLATVIALVGLLSVAAELAIRYHERHRTTPPDYFPSIFYPHKRLRYALIPNLDYYGWFRINSLGCRGREFSAAKKPGVRRIVCLGASTTFDIGCVGKDRPWPEVLETELQQRLSTRAVEVL